MTQFVLSICKSCPIQLNLPHKARNTDKVIAVIIIMFVFLLIKWYLIDYYFDWEILVNRKPHSMYLCMKDVSFVAWWTGLSGLSQASAVSITTLWCSSLIVCHLVYVYNLSLFSLLVQVRLFCCLFVLALFDKRIILQFAYINLQTFLEYLTMASVGYLPRLSSSHQGNVCDFGKTLIFKLFFHNA